MICGVQVNGLTDFWGGAWHVWSVGNEVLGPAWDFCVEKQGGIRIWKGDRSSTTC